MIKKLFVFSILLLFVGCASIEPVPDSEKQYEKIITVPSVKKAKLYELSNRWFADSFNSAESVIEYQDKDSGVIMGNYTFDTPGAAILYWCNMGKNKIALNFKDNAIRVKITHIGLHSTSGGFWRPAVQSEFEALNFKDNCDLMAAALEKYIKNANGGDSW